MSTFNGVNKTRRTEKLVDGHWSECQFMHLKKGDLFRMFEPDGVPVEKGATFLAESDAYEEKDMVGTIVADFYCEEECDD